MESHLRAEHVAFWNRLIPNLLARREVWMAGGSSSWVASSAFLTAELWTLAAACVVLLGIVAVLGALQVRHSMRARRRRRAAVGGGSSAAAGCKLTVGTAAVSEKQFNSSGTC